MLENKTTSQKLEVLELENTISLLSDVRAMKEQKDSEISKNTLLLTEERQRSRARESRLLELETKLRANESEGLDLKYKLSNARLDSKNSKEKNDDSSSNLHTIKQKNLKLINAIDLIKVECENLKIESSSAKANQKKAEREY